MPKTQKLVAGLLFLILLVSCNQTQTIAPTSSPTQTDKAQVDYTTNHIVISEIMAGVTGNNNLDFIELYNPTKELVNLKGFSLWYQLKQDQSDTLIYSWESSAFIPPYGHYLLLREGQDVGVETDAYFDYSLVPQRGSLAIRSRTEGIIDQVAWGDTDAPFVETKNTSQFQNDVSLERLPGGDAGNGQDDDNNEIDFILNKSPNPQSTASLSTPALAEDLELQVTVASEIQPGNSLTYGILITNTSSADINSATLHFPLSGKLEFESSSINSTQEEDEILFPMEGLSAGASVNFSITFKVAWEYTTITIPGVYIESETINSPVFSGPLRTVVQGGSVPIGIARTLLNGEDVIIEGTATMYTGGFYAGSSGTKFYIEDGSGGVQVYVPGGNGKVDVELGSLVRVQGIPQPYRGAIEVVPSTDNVNILEQSLDPFAWEPQLVTINELLKNPENFAGKLVTINGEVSRAEEFSYSYELDLVDENNLVGIYVDKLTEINVESVEISQFYQITGIAEVIDDNIQINPRVQSDLAEIQPPTVAMSVQMPINYDPTQSFTINIDVTNYLDAAINNLMITLGIPDGLSVDQVSDNGSIDSTQVLWNLDSLTGQNTKKSFSLSGTISKNLEYIKLENYSLSYSGQEEVIQGSPIYSFPGDSVPVWAIQGNSFRSPYLLEQVNTGGVVTAVFPEMEGFWIQGEEDGNPLTSDGLFVHSVTIDPTIKVGDLISVNGSIHEPHTETQLFLQEFEILSNNQPSPTPISLNPPTDHYEALEGMLVTVDGQAKAVSPTNKYGETALVLPLNKISHLMQGGENGMAIRVDDSSFVTHTDQSSMSYAASTGDYLSDITGPLAYNYGYYKIEPLTPPIVEKESVIIDALPEPASNEFRIMTWNVENLFDFLEPHPSDPALPTVAEYHVWLDKIANTILLADFPSVIAFQEVENIGVLNDLSENSILEAYNYQPVLLEGTDSRGIDVGYLVRGDTQIIKVEQFPAPNELTPRPPLLLQVQINQGAESKTISLLNNHFLSMSGGEQATEPRRIAQAAWNVELVNQILTQNPGAFVIVMGDLNSYYDSPPIDELRSAGMVHVFDQLLPEDRYTYIYQGIAQVLDHMLINDAYSNSIVDVDILHVDADYPLQMPGDTSALHKSDHDPVIVTFR